MPILDLKVKVSDMGDIHYQFYRKPMAQHQTILEKSAMPMRIKRQAFSQEVIRILRNTKGSLPWLDKAEHISQFVLRMKDSGYSEKFRLEIVQGGIRCFEKQVERDVSGECPLYRPGEFQREERDKAKKLKRVAWQKPSDSVLFVPPTPGSVLAKGLEEALNG